MSEDQHSACPRWSRLFALFVDQLTRRAGQGRSSRPATAWATERRLAEWLRA